eukprot:250678-Chlamydomonas_euryale.AAC.2
MAARVAPGAPAMPCSERMYGLTERCDAQQAVADRRYTATRRPSPCAGWSEPQLGSSRASSATASSACGAGRNGGGKVRGVSDGWWTPQPRRQRHRQVGLRVGVRAILVLTGAYSEPSLGAFSQLLQDMGDLGQCGCCTQPHCP